MSVSKKQSQYIAVALSIIITILFVGATIVRAHGSGASFEKQVENMLVDIGYSVEEFSTDSSVVFDFGLKDANEAAVEFTDVWVRIVKDTSTVFATGVHNARLGGAIMTYVFPESGDYELSVRYQNDGENISETTFPIVVKEKKDEEESNHFGILMLAALGLICALIFYVVKMNKKKKSLHE